MEIKIDQSKCTRCAKCTKVCPSLILRVADDSRIVVENPESCIVCGHCVAACNDSAVLHSEFPESKIHPIDYSLYPSAEQMMLLIKARRSNRAFSKKAIPAPLLDSIVEAAHRAPTASNMQQVKFKVITNPQQLHMISKFTLDTFTAVLKKLENPLLKPILKMVMGDVYRYVPLFKRMKTEFENGNDLILRKASAVVLIYTPASSRFGIEDSNLAYQNGSLMAECLGVSQFYTGFVLNAVKQDKGKLEQLLGIDGKIHAGMALGMPLFRMANYIDKKEIEKS